MAASSAPVLFRCDGGAAIGWGHAIRCAALAQALRAAGVESVFAMRAPDSGLAEYLEDAGQPVCAIPPDADDVEATAALLRELGSRLLVVDSYVLGRAFLDGVHAATSVPRVVIDDFDERDLACEAVVVGNHWAGELDLSGTGADLVLAGTEFALLRSEFEPGRRPARNEGDPPLVLITLGGGQLGAATVELAAAIDALDQPLRITVMLGSSSGAAIDSVREFARAASHEVEVEIDTRDVAGLLARTTLAVSAAGTTCFELAASGVPGVLVVVDDNQARGAAKWAELGAFESLGPLAHVDPALVAERANALLGDPSQRQSLSRRASELVPGDGARRVAAALIAAFDLPARLR